MLSFSDHQNYQIKQMENDLTLHEEDDGAEVVLSEKSTGEASAWHFKNKKPALKFLIKMRRLLVEHTGQMPKVNLPRRNRVSH